MPRWRKSDRAESSAPEPGAESTPDPVLGDPAEDPAARFIRVFSLAALQAAHVARRLQGNVPSWSKHEDTPEGAALTTADLAAQDVLLEPLRAAFPGVALDAEEDTALAGTFPEESRQRDLIVIDPIDGTLNYSRGSREYAVMGAYLRGGRYEAAVVAFPEYQTLYYALVNNGCWRMEEGPPFERVRVADLENLPDEVLLTPRAPRDWDQRLREAGWTPRRSHCSAVDASAPATGSACAAVSEHGTDRRRAIGLLLTLEAGGTVRTGGRNWARRDPGRDDVTKGALVVAANDDLAGRLRRLLT